jgi:hypothetical protein
MFPELDLRLGARIFVDQGFSMKNPKKIVWSVEKIEEMSQMNSFSHLFSGVVWTG